MQTVMAFFMGAALALAAVAGLTPRHAEPHAAASALWDSHDDVEDDPEAFTYHNDTIYNA